MNKKIFGITITFIICCLLISFAFVFYKNKSAQDTNHIVNIVFTTDKNYKDYLRTTIRTAIGSKNEDSVYNINILCIDLSKADCNKYKKLETKNVNINPMQLSLDRMKGVGEYEIEYYVTRADLFKFIMPELFPKLDKILYIDVDTAIIKDLTELYNIDLKDKFIAAMNKPVKNIEVEFWSDGNAHCKKVRRYNCGVLLYNLDLWRKHNITEKLIKEKNEDEYRDLMTQNIFNHVIHQNQIVKLPPKYNLLIHWNFPFIKQIEFYYTYPLYCLTHGCSFENLLKDAIIIHYVDNDKPWIRRDSKYSKYWLKYEKSEDN